MHRHRSHRSSRKTGRAAGTHVPPPPTSIALLSHHRKTLLREIIFGGGSGSILVDDYAMANYNGLVITVQHRLSSDLQPADQLHLVQVPEPHDAQGDYAGIAYQNPNVPGLTMAHAALTSATSKTLSWFSRVNSGSHRIASAL